MHRKQLIYKTTRYPVKYNKKQGSAQRPDAAVSDKKGVSKQIDGSAQDTEIPDHRLLQIHVGCDDVFASAMNCGAM